MTKVSVSGKLTELYDNFLFDMDGTILNTAPAIIKKLKAAMEENGAYVADASYRPEIIGPTADKIIKNLKPSLSPGQISAVLASFRRMYNADPVSHTQHYPGVKELVERLRREGKTAFVVTNKVLLPAEKLVEGTGFGGRFIKVYSPDMAPGGNMNKTEMILRLLSEYGLQAGRTVMFGDTMGDVNAARGAGCAAAAVGWGYAPDKAELRNSADFYFPSVEDVAACF